MENTPLKAELADLFLEMQKTRGQAPQMLLARLMMFSAKVQEEGCEVPADIFEALDNDGRRMCLVALITICASTLAEKSGA